MIDGFLLEFQVGEILDAIKVSLCVTTLVISLALWRYTTHTRKNTE